MQKLYRPFFNTTVSSIFNSKHIFLTCAFLFPIFLFSQVAENCTNGIDDDGDGLIDCFDTDCTCTGQCDDFYYTTCNADCYYVPPCNQISLGVQWTATAQTDTYSPLVAGDMDNDGIPDIVTYRCEMNSIYIIDGATGATKVTITSPTNLPGGTAPAIADLDKDGFGELIIIGEDRRLRCYEHTGALKYTSANQVGYNVGYRFSVPNIADFDHNGWPEINIGNQVYNGQTGALLASGGAANAAGEHPFRRANSFSFNMPVAIDALPDAFCADCAGLEIVAGNQVFSVNLTTGAVIPVVSAPAGYSDGFTSVVDFDRDGDLDALVQGQKNGQNTVYCWEIQSPTILREFQLLNNYIEAASRVNVADLNGDGELEISFVGHPWLYALKNDFTELWRNPTNDVSSVTCSSVFDFCGDGSADVVYRGQTHLQILEGATGAIKWQDNCISATHIENPLILDVDADGQTEVVIECGIAPGMGTVVCYEAIGTPGISSRKVWNQHAYISTNINEDLSVPQYQQNHSLVGDSLKMNTFLNQFFNPTFPSPDGQIAFKSVSCEEDTMEITIEICNTGDNVLSAQMPVSVYRGNPLTTPAIYVGTAPVGTIVNLGQCTDLVVRLPRDLVINDTIYLALNDDNSQTTPYSISQFPFTALGECGFTNNFASFFYAYNPDNVALGNDTTICDNAIVNVDASGNDLVSWVWQDGAVTSAYTIEDPGVFFVNASDICGVVHTDTINVFIDSSTVVSIGPDLVICQGETVTVGETGFEYYDWKPGPDYDCNNCPSVNASLPISGNIILEAGFANGCKSIDTLFLTVNDTFYTKIDTFMCKGTVFTMAGEDVFPGESRYFNFASFAGCDSTILVNVFAKDTFATSEMVIICPGTTYNVFGEPKDVSGIYSKRFTALQNGCDSTHTIELVVQPLLSLNLSSDSSCVNEPTGALHAIAIGGLAPFQYDWSFNAPSQPDLTDLPPGAYALTITDANQCTSTASTTIGGYPPIVFALTADSVQCFGQANGAINIASNDPTLMYSLNNEPFVQTDAFTGLTASDYTVYAADAYGCSDTANISIGQPGALLLTLPSDASILFGDSVFINIQTTATDIVRFSWNSTAFLRDSMSLKTWSQPHTSVQYSLTLTDANGCTASDMMEIMVERIKQVFVPNVILLDLSNDINAKLSPGFGSSVLKVNNFQVFDRWGDLVHRVTNAAPGDSGINWNGEVRNKTADPGVYVWLLEVTLIDGTVEKYKGDVTVLR